MDIAASLDITERSAFGIVTDLVEAGYVTVLHDDADYRTVARHAPDLGEHGIFDIS